MHALRRLINRPSSIAQPRRVGPIGLELAREKLHMVQLERLSNGEITVRARVSLPYPMDRDVLMASPFSLKSLLRQHLKLNRFQGRRAVVTMPSSDVRILSVPYQGYRAQSDDEAILKVLKDRIDGELADYVIDYLPVRANAKDEERLAVVAIAARRAVYDYLELLRKAGLQIGALEIGPVALKRLIMAMLGPECFDNVLVVNFGHTESYLTMISGRRLLFDQEIDFGEHALLQYVAEIIEMSMEAVRKLIYQHGFGSNDNQPKTAESMISDADVNETLYEIVKPKFLSLSDEIERALIYAASETRGQTVKRVYLAGSIARWKGADELLNTLLDIPVSSILEPCPAIEDAPGTDSVSFRTGEPEMAIATGLALHGMIQDG